MRIDATDLYYKQLNERIKASEDRDIIIDGCFGQRYIGDGLKDKNIEINGTPGNALGAYMDGAHVVVRGNGQDAVGDTMNDGTIYIHGNCGDALGYGMRGGKIYIQGDSSYRTGIHMKEYQEKKPVIMVGGTAGSFLGEYMAGGIIVVLGLGSTDCPVGEFCGTGMHGGKMFIRSSVPPEDLPIQVKMSVASAEELKEIQPYLQEFAEEFSQPYESIIGGTFYLLKPDAKNPYKRMYTTN